jgi:hypothetical protein
LDEKQNWILIPKGIRLLAVLGDPIKTIVVGSLNGEDMLSTSTPQLNQLKIVGTLFERSRPKHSYRKINNIIF